MVEWKLQVQRHGELASLVCIGNRGNQFIGQLKVAANGWNRLLGWNARGSALGVLLTPCRSIHTFAMNIDIDLIWLNKRNEIVHVETSVKPSSWRYRADAQSVIELPAGVLAKHGFKNVAGGSEPKIQNQAGIQVDIPAENPETEQQS